MELLPTQLAHRIRAAIQAAQANGALPEFDLPETITVQRSAKPELGDYASPVALQLAKAARRKPLDVAQAIAAHLPAGDAIGAVEVAPPGFINFRLAGDWVLAQVDAIIAAGDEVFAQEIGRGKKAQVECVSANPTGPITVGRTRGGVIGSTMANLLQALGYETEMEYYFNNAGRQMQLLGLSLQARYRQALGQPLAGPGQGRRVLISRPELLRQVRVKVVVDDQAGSRQRRQSLDDRRKELTIIAVVGNRVRSLFQGEEIGHRAGTVWSTVRHQNEDVAQRA